MKILYLDLIGGASGDMLLGALIDAGVPVENLAKSLKALQLDEFELAAIRVEKNGFSATKVNVIVGKQPPERHLKEILAIIESSTLPAGIKERASTIFKNIARVEADIHGKQLEDVHLHELGGTDTIVDVTGVLLAIDMLGISRIHASRIPLGSGSINGAHGLIPLPAPATIGLLKGLPVRGTDIQSELVTPTGAAILAEIVDHFSPAPEMTITATGYGAGSRDLPVPNLIRAILGDAEQTPDIAYEKLALVSTNLDDLNPETYPYLMELLFETGALDVCLLPIQMKKGRPGTQIQVLSDLDTSASVKDILFKETTTLGIRQVMVDRICLPRESVHVETPLGTVRIKVAVYDKFTKVSPEYEDCRKIAQKYDLPLQQVYQEAIQAYNSQKWDL